MLPQRLARFSLPQDYSLYFTQAQDLLDIFTDMEEKSLPLVQKSQQTSETLDQLQTKIDAVHIDQHQQAQHLQEKIDQVEQTIRDTRERERLCQTVLTYVAPCRKLTGCICCTRENRNEKNDPFIEQLVKAVENLYQRHILSADAGVSTHRMIEALETRMKSLLNVLEQADPFRLVEAEKVRDRIVSRGKIESRSIISAAQHCRSNCRATREITTRETKHSNQTSESIASRHGPTVCESLSKKVYTWDWLRYTREILDGSKNRRTLATIAGEKSENTTDDRRWTRTMDSIAGELKY